jgi:hypothetical protein
MLYRQKDWLTLNEFDEMLIDVVDKVMKCSFGQDNASVIFEYLAKKSCSLTEIPQKLPLFSLELRKVLDSEETRVYRSRANIQSSAELIEETILRLLCLRIARARMKLTGVGLGELGKATFAEYISKLKEAYLAKKASQENFGTFQTVLASATSGGEDT